MIPLTTMTAERTGPNFFISAIYAGICTAIPAILAALMIQAEQPFGYIPAFLLIGAGPVVGYGLAAGRLGREIVPLILGILSFLTIILSFIIWPILVGISSRSQSFFKLLFISIIGFALGIGAFLLVATGAGQDTVWFATGIVLLCAVWGGTCGAAMGAWGRA